MNMKYVKTFLFLFMFLSIFLAINTSFAVSENDTQDTIQEMESADSTILSDSTSNNDISKFKYTKNEENTINKKNNISSYKTATMVNVSDETELINELKKDTSKIINLENKTYHIATHIQLKKEGSVIVIEGNGATIDIQNYDYFISFTKYHDMTINNLTFTNISKCILYSTCPTDITLNDCTLNCEAIEIESSRDSTISIREEGTININNSILNNAIIRSDNPDTILNICNSQFNAGFLSSKLSLNSFNNTFTNTSINIAGQQKSKIHDTTIKNNEVKITNNNLTIINSLFKKADIIFSSEDGQINIQDSTFDGNAYLRLNSQIRTVNINNCNFTEYSIYSKNIISQLTFKNNQLDKSSITQSYLVISNLEFQDNIFHKSNMTIQLDVEGIITISNANFTNKTELIIKHTQHDENGQIRLNNCIFDMESNLNMNIESRSDINITNSNFADKTLTLQGLDNNINITNCNITNYNLTLRSIDTLNFNNNNINNSTIKLINIKKHQTNNVSLSNNTTLQLNQIELSNITKVISNKSTLNSSKTESLTLNDIHMIESDVNINTFTNLTIENSNMIYASNITLTSLNIENIILKNDTFNSKSNLSIPYRIARLTIEKCTFNNKDLNITGASDITYNDNRITSAVISLFNFDSLTMNNNTFLDSSSTFIYSADNSEATISNNHFINNKALETKGIYTGYALSLHFINNIFDNAPTLSLNGKSTVTIESNIFTNYKNKIIENNAESLLFINNNITNMNIINPDNSNGLLIQNKATMTISNNEFTNINLIVTNQSADVKGAFISNTNNLIIKNNTFKENKILVPKLTGLIFNQMNITLDNNTFSNNYITASDTIQAGILYDRRGSTSLATHSLIRNNNFNSTFKAKKIESAILYNQYSNNTITGNKFYNTVAANSIRSASIVNFLGSMNIKGNDFSKITYSCDGKIYTRVIYDYENQQQIEGLSSNTYSSNNVTVTNMQQLQLEMNEVFSKKIITIKKGTYKLDDQLTMITSKYPLTIYGQNSTIDGNSKYKFLSVESAIKLTITGLNINNMIESDNAAAIETTELATVTIDNCTFINNTSTGKGGSLGNRGNMTVIRCVFINNTASTGGAIWSTGEYGGHITITNCTFLKNTAHFRESNDRTAVIYTVNNGSNLIEKNIFNNNTGRCIHNYLDSFNVINNNTFMNINYNYHQGELRGGIIDNYEADMTVTNNIFRNLTVNSSEIHGGLIYHEIGNAKILNNTFNNTHFTATGKNPIINGAIVWNRNATMLIDNNNMNYTIKATKTYGSGIYNNIGNITVTNNTFQSIIEVTQQVRGGAIFNDYDDEIFVKGNLTYGDNDFSQITIAYYPNIIIVNRTVHNDGNMKIIGSPDKGSSLKGARLTIRLPQKIETGQTATFTVMATDTQIGTPLNGTAIIKINGITLKDDKGKQITIKITEGQGVLKYALKGYSARVYNVTAVFAKTKYARAEVIYNMTVTKGTYANPQINIIGCSEKEITLNYTLKDNNGNIIGGKNKISLKIGGKTILTTTTIDGKLNAKIKLPYLPSGKVNVTINLGNNYRYDFKQINTTATIYKQNVTVNITKLTAKAGSTITLKAKLTNKETKSNVISGKYIFKVNGKTVPLVQNGKNITTTKIISNGQATWIYTLPDDLKTGLYDITLVYNGNTQSNAIRYSSKALTIIE